MKSEEISQAHLNNLIEHHQLRMSQEEVKEKLREAKTGFKLQDSLFNINKGYQTDHALGRHMYLDYLKAMIHNNSESDIKENWKEYRMYFK